MTLFLTFFAPATGSICPAGVYRVMDEILMGIYSRAYIDCSDASGMGSVVLKLRGSFVSRTTSSHTFTLWSETYFTSILLISKCRFLWEGVKIDERNGTWSWGGVSLIRDFRYDMSAETTMSYYWSRLSVSVSFDGFATQVADGDLIGICRVSGCRDDAHDRSAYECQPSPSPTGSHTPSPTTSRPPSPTVSGTPSPTASASRTPAFAPSSTLTPSARFPESPNWSPKKPREPDRPRNRHGLRE
jgi:hypothetical protein